jgi:hypothetical protein
MKLPSPIVTLLVGVLIATAVTLLSIRANDAGTRPTPTDQQYGAAAEEVTR